MFVASLDTLNSLSINCNLKDLQAKGTCTLLFLVADNSKATCATVSYRGVTPGPFGSSHALLI